MGHVLDIVGSFQWSIGDIKSWVITFSLENKVTNESSIFDEDENENYT